MSGFKKYMDKLIKPRKNELTKDEVAALLRIDKDALAAFEAAYQSHVIEQEYPENLFDMNSKQAVRENRTISPEEAYAQAQQLEEMKECIINELLANTSVYRYDGSTVTTMEFSSLTDGVKPVDNAEIFSHPENLRPQLTGSLMKKDIEGDSYPSLLYLYNRYLKSGKADKTAYHMFRQGLDILDLDAVVYEIIATNPDSIGHWFPALVEACKGFDFFHIPATTIARVPLTLLQLTRQEYTTLTQTTLDIVDGWAYKAFDLDETKEYFIKTGTFSSKFDFRNAYVHGAKEVKELGEYLLFIHYQALMMASPLSKPCIYGASTTVEWVVREFIHDKENNPSIYKGLPLHTEYRVFVDCDDDVILTIVPYWEPNTMKQRFGHESDADSPHQIHDYIIYQAHENTLMQRYYANRDLVREHIQELLPNLNLTGQWSIDIMQNGDDFWIIDMARAETSAFYEYVPMALRNPAEEDWLPILQ